MRGMAGRLPSAEAEFTVPQEFENVFICTWFGYPGR